MGGLKKCVIWMLFLVLLSAFVSAEIVVNGPDQSNVNIGDEININGYVIWSEDILGLLTFELNCGEESNVLMVKSISLRNGVKKDFSEEFAIVSVNENSCSVEVSITHADSVLERTSSSSFIVTKALTGSINIDKESVQTGEKIKIEGTSFKQNGEEVVGFGIVSLTKEGNIYFSDSFDIKKGLVKYSIETTDIPGGEYSLDLEVRDSFGNFVILNGGKLLLISKIDVNAHSDKSHYLPKEKISIEGTASILEGKLKSGVVYVSLNDEIYEDVLKNGNFDTNFYLSGEIKSGKHAIDITLEDEIGNYGDYSFSIIVDPIPTKILVVADKEGINPGDIITIKTFLNDQAGDLIEQPLTVKVVDEDGDVYYDAVKNSGEQFDVTISEDVVPGNYFVRAEYGEVTGEKLFIVGKVIALNYSIEGQILTIRNVGNVPYEGPLNVGIKGGSGTSSITKDLDLGIGQDAVLNLGVGMISGIYEVEVNGEVFSEVEITGVKKNNYNWLIWIGIVWIVLLLWFFWKGSKTRMRGRINKTLKKRLIKKPNRKHGEFGGAPMSVSSDREHVQKYKAYMGRVVSFNRKPKKIKGLGKRKKDGGFFNYFGFKKKKTEAPLNVPVSNVFSGVRSGWAKKDVTVPKTPDKEPERGEKKKDEPKEGWFNMFG